MSNDRRPSLWVVVGCDYVDTTCVLLNDNLVLTFIDLLNDTLSHFLLILLFRQYDELKARSCDFVGVCFIFVLPMGFN